MKDQTTVKKLANLIDRLEKKVIEENKTSPSTLDPPSKTDKNLLPN